MLLYSLLHLTGYDLPLEELKNFRQLHSKTPVTRRLAIRRVETTTGPLGQGLANAVGLAIAERTLAAQFNQPDHEIVDHFTYVFMGDGCLMEGISHEVCSLAGTLGLGKLIGFTITTVFRLMVKPKAGLPTIRQNGLKPTTGMLSTRSTATIRRRLRKRSLKHKA